MKTLLSYFAVALYLVACNPTHNSVTDNPGKSGPFYLDDSPFVKDTVRINYIDSIALAVNKNMFHKPKLNHIDVSHFGQDNLKIGYYSDTSNDITRILVTENEYRVLNIKYIFYKDGKPLLMHYRFWDKNPSPQYTEETYIYFDNGGKMFYAGDRSAQIYEGEIPAKLKTIELATPKKSKKELYDFTLKYWNMAKPLIDKDKAAKAANTKTQ